MPAINKGSKLLSVKSLSVETDNWREKESVFDDKIIGKKQRDQSLTLTNSLTTCQTTCQCQSSFLEKIA